MEWAKDAIENLSRGENAELRPRGHSMSGHIEDGDLVTLEPVVSEDLNVGDIVLARVAGKRRALVVLHRILERRGDSLLIGAANGRVDGWIEAVSVFGRATKIEP